MIRNVDAVEPRRARPQLADLVEPGTLQLMMDDFYALTSIPMALIDTDGTVLVGAGWQEICTAFHRANAESCAHCVESDTVLTAGIPSGEAQLYKCKNGMWDAATPVEIDGERLGNLFTGQFFFDDEPLDLEFFRSQARYYGFDEDRYLAAVAAAPRLSRDTVDTGLRFLTRLSSVISRLSLTNLQLARTEEELRFALAGQTTLLEQSQEATRLNEALMAIDNSIHGTLEMEEMLGRVIVEAAEVLGCESSALDIRRGDGWVISHVYRFPEDSVGRVFSDTEVPFAAMAARERQPIIINNAFDDPRVDPDLQRAYNVRSVMVTPLIMRDQVHAALFFNYHERFHTFTEPEVTFARRLSAALSLGMENARLYDAQHTIADRLQEALLSLPDGVAGIEFAHTYQSATESARVGGDFYDIFELDGGRIGVLIGDVAGKGLDAAVLTSLVKNTIRAHAAEPHKTPSRVLALANDAIFKATPPEAFATVFYAAIDPDAGHMVYANAGHTPALVLRDGRDAHALPSTGTMLGAFSHAEFAEGEHSLAVDDVLFLYTDGLTEARRNGEFFGQERLIASMPQNTDMLLSRLVQHVVAEVLAFSGSRLTDDAAVLALRLSEREA